MRKYRIVETYNLNGPMYYQIEIGNHIRRRGLFGNIVEDYWDWSSLYTTYSTKEDAEKGLNDLLHRNKITDSISQRIVYQTE
jgi:hypothetical protein